MSQGEKHAARGYLYTALTVNRDSDTLIKLSILERLLSQDENTPELYWQSMNRSIQFAEEAAMSDPNNPFAHYIHGLSRLFMYECGGDSSFEMLIASATALYSVLQIVGQPWIFNPPYSGPYFYNLGLVLKHLGEFNDSLNCFQEASTLMNWDYTLALNEIHNILQHLDNIDYLYKMQMRSVPHWGSISVPTVNEINNFVVPLNGYVKVNLNQLVDDVTYNGGVLVGVVQFHIDHLDIVNRPKYYLMVDANFHPYILSVYGDLVNHIKIFGLVVIYNPKILRRNFEWAGKVKDFISVTLGHVGQEYQLP